MGLGKECVRAAQRLPSVLLTFMACLLGGGLPYCLKVDNQDWVCWGLGFSGRAMRRGGWGHCDQKGMVVWRGQAGPGQGR